MKKIEIYNSFFRNKKLSLQSKFNYFKTILNLDSKFYVDEFDPEIIKEFNFDKLQEFKK